MNQISLTHGLARVKTIQVLALVALFAAAAAEAEQASVVDPAKLPAPASQSGITYSADIKPILDKSCIRCHGAERPKAKLRLDSLTGVLRGSEDGQVIRPGKSAESQLVHSVAHLGNKDKFMPPPENKAGILPLTTEQISLIRGWIDQGAK